MPKFVLATLAVGVISLYLYTLYDVIAHPIHMELDQHGQMEY